MSQATFIMNFAKELKAGLSSEEVIQLEDNIDYWLGDHTRDIKIGTERRFGSIAPVDVDAILWYAYNIIISGTTRAGKTTSVKTLSYTTIKKLGDIIKRINFFDLEKQFVEFDKYSNTRRYQLYRMKLVERYELIISEVERIMARTEGEGERELFVFDEAQNFVPEMNLTAEGHTRKEKKLRKQCKNAIIRLLEQGLKRNASVILVTPTITRTAKTAMNLCGTKILFRLENTDAVRKIAEAIPRKYINSILTFKAGDCLISGEGIGNRNHIFCTFKQIEKLKTYSMVRAN